MLHISGINYESMVDGEGVRAAIYLSGCTHRCPGCHNPETHDPEYGKPATPELIRKIAREIVKRKAFLSGVTLTGGDPFYDPLATCQFLTDLWKELLDTDYPVDKLLPWVYTGYTLDEILQLAPTLEVSRQRSCYHLLSVCDHLVDGPFIQEKADKSLAFKGSTNQRIWTRAEIHDRINPKESEA